MRNLNLLDAGMTLIPKPLEDVFAQLSVEGRYRHNPKGPSRFTAKAKEGAK